LPKRAAVEVRPPHRNPSQINEESLVPVAGAFLSRLQLRVRLRQIGIVEELLQQPRSVVLERRQELALQSREIADALSAELA
jgi:hypothetical protein